MPTVAIVDGIRIIFYGNDHGLPHFHAAMAEHRAAIDIDTLAIVKGSLPSPAQRKIVNWASTRRIELLDAWERARAGHPKKRIK